MEHYCLGLKYTIKTNISYLVEVVAFISKARIIFEFKVCS